MINELIYLKEKMATKEIIIADDMFNFDLPRTKALLREIIRHNFGFKIQLPNGIRADFVDRELSHLMKLAGVYKVALGIESGSQAVVNFLKKRLDLKVLPETVRLFHEEGITVYGYFIMGLPVENRNSLIYSVDFAKKIDLDVPNFFNLVLYQGIKLYDYVQKRNDMQISIQSKA